MEQAVSYDIRMVDTSGETVEFEQPHNLRGGTYVVGGTREAWLNITYNYAFFYYEHIDREKGIRALYGMTGEQATPLLVKAIAVLGTDRSENYWALSPGNAGAALADLLVMARALPQAIFEGD